MAAPGPLPARVLEEPVRLVDQDAKAALAAFEKIKGSALSDAYIGYLLLQAGDEAASKSTLMRARDELSGPTRSMASADRSRSAMFNALRVLRLAIEESDREGEPPVACGVFARHGRDALDAFGGMWGSTRDSYGRAMKNHCLDKVLRAAAPAKADEIIKATTELFDGMIDVAPMPEGTMFYAIYVGTTDVVRDLLLSPEVPIEVDPRGKPAAVLDMAVKTVQKADPGIGKRLVVFRAKQTRLVPTLGEGVCAVLAARGKSAEKPACDALAGDAATLALGQWIYSAHTLD